MRLRAAIEGNLHQAMRAESRAMATAVTTGVREATEGLQRDLRADVVNAGLGYRVARAWRKKLYPNDGVNAAGMVWSNASHIIRANEGATIKSQDGFFLAIPTENAPRRGVGGKRISPSNFPEHRFGRLRFVYRRGAPSLLVADNLQASFRRATGELRGFRRASQRNQARGQTTTVVMFILVPQVQLPRRLDTGRQTRKWESRLPDLIVQNYPENLPPAVGDDNQT